MSWMDEKERLIIAITGATGAIYGVRLLEVLRNLGNVETHVVISDAAFLTIKHELGLTKTEVEALAHISHDVQDIGAVLASGSFKSGGMVIAPCSMRTLGAISHGLSDNLITRAADVILKERRRLVLMVRETPLHLVHLRNMVAVTEMGGIIFPPVPGFYHHPETVSEIIDQTVGRVLDMFSLQHELASRWAGLPSRGQPGPRT